MGNIIDKRVFNNLNAIEDVCENNKVQHKGDDFSREAKLLGGFVTEIHRRKIENNPKEQRKIAHRIRKNLGFI